MDIYSAFPSKYLKSSDLQGRQCKVIMDRIDIEEIGSDRRPVVYFRGKEKGLVINKTNANAIADMYGSNTNGWIGKEILIFPTRVDFKGERVDAIRVQYIEPPRQSALAPAPAPAHHDERNPPPRDDMNDDVPF
jgi:hypothetical protein